MEREIGEKFEFENTILEVTEIDDEYDCSVCYLLNKENGDCLNENFEITGDCVTYNEERKISMIFKEVD